LYDPAAGSWIATSNLTQKRYLHTATSLQDGKLLIAGGVWENGLVLADVELGTAHR
jgi:hypothetical protein